MRSDPVAIAEEFIAEGKEAGLKVYANAMSGGCTIIGESTNVLSETTADVEVGGATVQTLQNRRVEVVCRERTDEEA